MKKSHHTRSCTLMLHIINHGFSWSTLIIVMHILHTQLESCQKKKNKINIVDVDAKKRKSGVNTFVTNVNVSPFALWCHRWLDNIIGFVNAFMIIICFPHNVVQPLWVGLLMNLTSKNNGPLLNESKLGLGSMAHSCQFQPCSCLYSIGWVPYYINNVMRIKI